MLVSRSRPVENLEYFVDEVDKMIAKVLTIDILQCVRLHSCKLY